MHLEMRLAVGDQCVEGRRARARIRSVSAVEDLEAENDE